MTDEKQHDDWQTLWAMPEEDEMNLAMIQEQFDVRRTRQRWRERLEVLGIVLGMSLTIGFLVFSPITASLVVLVLFCWAVWGISFWSSRDTRKTAREVITRPPTEFVQALRAHCEARARLLALGRYMLVAVGVFCAVWTAWVMSANWEADVLEPWRGVVGVGGILFFYGAAIYLHAGEARRLAQETEELEGLERRLEAP